MDGAVHFEHGAPLGKASALRVVPIKEGRFAPLIQEKLGAKLPIDLGL